MRMKTLVFGVTAVLLIAVRLYAQDYLLSYVKSVEEKNDFKYFWCLFDPVTEEKITLVEGEPARVAWNISKKEVYYIVDNKIFTYSWTGSLGKKPEAIGEFPENSENRQIYRDYLCLNRAIWLNALSHKIQRAYCVHLSTEQYQNSPEQVPGEDPGARSAGGKEDRYLCYVDEYGEKGTWKNIYTGPVTVIGDERDTTQAVVSGFEKVAQLEQRVKYDELLKCRNYASMHGKITDSMPSKVDREKIRKIAKLSDYDESYFDYVPFDTTIDDLAKTKRQVLKDSNKGVIITVDPGPEDSPDFTQPMIFWDGNKYYPVNIGKEGQVGICLTDKYFLYGNVFLDGPLGIYDLKACRHILVDENARDAILLPK